MPFRRRFRRRRRRRRPRRFRRPMRRTRRLVMDPEKKFIDGQAVQVVTNTGNVFFMNPVSSGVDANDRIGLRHLNTLISVKIVARNDPAILSPAAVRIAIVLQKNVNGLQFTPAQLYISNGGLFASRAPRNLLNTKNLKILWKWDVVIPLENNNSQASVTKRIRIQSSWINELAPIANLAQNGLFLFLISDVSLVGGAPPLVTFTTRVRFVG